MLSLLLAFPKMKGKLRIGSEVSGKFEHTASGLVKICHARYFNQSKEKQKTVCFLRRFLSSHFVHEVFLRDSYFVYISC